MTLTNLYFSYCSTENLILALTGEMQEICMLEELVTGAEDVDLCTTARHKGSEEEGAWNDMAGSGLQTALRYLDSYAMIAHDE
ncbi:Uncharacterized protein DAT39_008827, partial [Clarias magur]